MTLEELKERWFWALTGIALEAKFKAYPKEETDEVLDSLKKEIAELKDLNHDLCERVTENDGIRLHWEEIEQTRAECERLKARIAELEETHKMEVERLLILNKEQAVNADRLRNSMERVIRRQKYKRSLEKAKWCNYWANYWELCEPSDCSKFIAKAKYYRKWRDRWMEIASKFKESK